MLFNVEWSCKLLEIKTLLFTNQHQWNVNASLKSMISAYYYPMGIQIQEKDFSVEWSICFLNSSKRRQ